MLTTSISENRLESTILVQSQKASFYIAVKLHNIGHADFNERRRHWFSYCLQRRSQVNVEIIVPPNDIRKVLTFYGAVLYF